MWSVLQRLLSSTGLLGEAGEREAARYLRRKNFRILQRRMRNRFGEIDLIALDDKTLVFVEVKTRTSADHGAPVEAVTAEKQRRLTNAAMAYLKRYRQLDRRYRFDVVSVVWPEGATQPQIVHYVNAFDAIGQGQFYS